MSKGKTIRMLTVFLLLTALLLAACQGTAAGGASTAPAEDPAPEAAPAAESAAPAAPETNEAPAAEALVEPEMSATAEPGAVPEETKAEAETAVLAAEPRIVECGTVEDFLKAIAPNTTIRLTGRSYELSAALGYGNFGGDYYEWLDLYGEWELVISGVNGLRIEAVHPGTEIVTLPTYANVIRFDNCSDVCLSGLTIGHIEGAGYCSGSVLRMLDCEDMRVENCELYGCGTYGLELDRCRNLSCRETVIRDCSTGAMTATTSSGIVLDSCRITGISGQDYTAVLSLSNCSGCGVLNSLVRSCSGTELLRCNYVRDFRLAGCEIANNRFGGMFFVGSGPVTVDGCSFRKNEMENGWYSEPWGGSESERVVDPNGRIYEDYELYELELKTDVSWTPAEPEIPEQKQIEASADGMIHVSTVDELLASIAPGAKIYLEDGVYALAEATGFGSYAGEYYYWMPCYDGPGLVISGADDLTITAGGPHRVTITAMPRYADVLTFENCSGLTIQNITAGHTQEPGSCTGGVLCFRDSASSSVQDCSLYGCGTIGVTAYSSRDLAVRYTEIHDCSDGAFFFLECDGVTIERCNVHDVDGSTYYTYNCKNISADGKIVPEGTSW